MEIPLYITEELKLRLSSFDAVQPTSEHVKADNWKLLYKLYLDTETLLDNGIFTSNYLIYVPRRLLVIEEYDMSILDKEEIKTVDDFILYLRIFDFEKHQTGKFSKVTGGKFILQKLTEKELLFSKEYNDHTKGFLIDLADIKMENIIR